MKSFFIFIFLILFLTSCQQKCDESYILVNNKCCYDGNGNDLCDIDEGSSVTTTTTTQTTTTTISNSTNSLNSTNITNTTIAQDLHFNQTEITNTDENEQVPVDCTYTELVAGRATYWDGNESKLFLILTNSGGVDITGLGIQIYNDDGKAYSNDFTLNISAGAAEELKLELGDKEIINSNNEINLIRIFPKIPGKTCDYELIHREDITQIDD